VIEIVLPGLVKILSVISEIKHMDEKMDLSLSAVVSLFD
jgi:hypothetical protein